LKPLVAADAASQQDLDAAVAALRAAESNTTAAKANVDQVRLSTETQISSNAGKVEALRGALRNAQLNVQYGTIRAPISGRIGDSMIAVGGLVTPNSQQPLTTIVPLDPIWVRFKVTESEYLSWAKRGQATPGRQTPVTLMLADGTEFPWKGIIDNATNQVDPKTGTLELQARFPNPRHTLLPGQFGRVRLRVEEQKGVIVIPDRAIQQMQNLQSVFVVNGENKVEARPVTTAGKSGDLRVIEKGLNPGERVIAEGQLRVRPGVQVQAKPYKGGQ
jgi:membrane fusion protein (multidrug efflux system)